ncbi:MAG: glycosyltransferase family 39 protein [Bryobacteraceae bacterium]
MPQAFYILFGAAFTGAVSWASGRLLFDRLKLKLYRSEEHVLAFMAGSALLSLLMFLLAAVHGVHKGLLLALGAAILFWTFRSGANKAIGEPLPSLPRAWRIVIWVAFVLFGVLYLTNAMAPEMSPDGCAYHLRFVGDYQRAHGFVRITTNMYANLSQGLELLFLFAYVFGRHSAAAMVHMMYLFALPWMLIMWGRRNGHAAAGAAAAMFTFLSPVMGIDGTSAYNDVAIAAVLFAAFYLADIWREERQAALLPVAGLMAGFGYAIKYTAFLAVPYVLGVVAWTSWRAKQNWWRPALVVALAAFVMIAPWVVKNAVWVDNPFSPFFNKVFPNRYVHVDFEESYRYMMRHYGDIQSYRQMPLELTVRGGALGGLLGPLFLLAPLGLAAVRYPAGRRVLLAALLFASTYFTNVGTRFLIPALPFVSLAMAMAVAQLPWLALALVVAHGVLSWPPEINKYCTDYAWRLNRILYRQALRIVPEEKWLTEKAPQYEMARMVEGSTAPDAVILAFNQIAESYTTRKIMVSFQAATNRVLADMLWIGFAPDLAPTWHHTFRFPARQVRRVRLVQTAGNAPDLWSVSEVRFLANEKELPRAAAWRVRADPNPWDVQMAFDNSPATRWRSWRKIEPGMFIETDFGRLETIDSVRVECSRDQYKIRMKLEGMDSAGHWSTLSDASQTSDAPVPVGLRRMVTQELKARGVTHLLIWDSDYGADEIRVNALAWGVTQVRELGPVRLYKLN